MRPRETRTPGSFGSRPLLLLSQSSDLKIVGRPARRPAPCLPRVPMSRPTPAVHGPWPRCGGRRSYPAVPRCDKPEFVIIHLTRNGRPQETRTVQPFCAIIGVSCACCAAVIRAWRVVRAGLCCAAVAYDPPPTAPARHPITGHSLPPWGTSCTRWRSSLPCPRPMVTAAFRPLPALLRGRPRADRWCSPRADRARAASIAVVSRHPMSGRRYPLLLGNPRPSGPANRSRTAVSTLSQMVLTAPG